MTRMSPRILRGYSTEYATWIAEVLEDGSRQVVMSELRVLRSSTLPRRRGSAPITQSMVARLAWRAETGEIENLWVHPSLRRQGVATRLWLAADPISGRLLKHSTWRTDDGDAWARAMAAKYGQELPERRAA